MLLGFRIRPGARTVTYFAVIQLDFKCYKNECCANCILFFFFTKTYSIMLEKKIILTLNDITGFYRSDKPLGFSALRV